MTDRYASNTRGATPIGPAERHGTITPSATPLDPRPRAIYCAADGTLTIEDAEATSLDYTLTAGQILPMRPTKVTAIASGTFYWWEDDL